MRKTLVLHCIAYITYPTSYIKCTNAISLMVVSQKMNWSLGDFTSYALHCISYIKCTNALHIIYQMYECNICDGRATGDELITSWLHQLCATLQFCIALHKSHIIYQMYKCNISDGSVTWDELITGWLHQLYAAAQPCNFPSLLLFTACWFHVVI